MFICTLHPTASPNHYQWRGKNSTQDVKLPIKHYDMWRKVTGFTSHLLFHLIKKISFRYGHRCSRLMIFRPMIFFSLEQFVQASIYPHGQTYSSHPYKGKTNDLHLQWALNLPGRISLTQKARKIQKAKKESIFCVFTEAFGIVVSLHIKKKDPLITLRNAKFYHYS